MSKASFSEEMNLLQTDGGEEEHAQLACPHPGYQHSCKFQRQQVPDLFLCC